MRTAFRTFFWFSGLVQIWIRLIQKTLGKKANPGRFSCWDSLPFGLMLMLLMSGCDQIRSQPVDVIPTRAATNMVSPTATILWFPPTATPRPILTPSPFPTINYLQGVGEVFLKDDFSKETGWQTVRNDTGSIEFGNNELTIAMGKNKGTLSSFSSYKPIDDFYLQLTVNVSLCSPGDSFGALVRVNSGQDYYRVVASCDGTARLERVNNGKIAIVQDWVPSGKIRPGAPQLFRFGVWALNGELRVFIDDAFQFSISDSVFSNGSIGVFARSSGAGALTVSFSDLQVHSLNAIPTPTRLPPTATQLTTSQPKPTKRP
jgi:hypothetical protein